MTLRAPSSFAKGRTPTSKCSHGGYPAPSVVERMLGLGLALSEIECAQGLKVAARLSCKAVRLSALLYSSSTCDGTVKPYTGVGITCASRRSRIAHMSDEMVIVYETYIT